MGLALTRVPRWRIALDAVLAVLAGGFGALCVQGVLSEPFGGMRAPLYFIIAAMILVAGNRALALPVKLMPPGVARNVVRVAKWTVPFVLPYLAIPALEVEVQARQLARVQDGLAPLVRHAERHARDTSAPRAEELPRLSFARAIHYRRDLAADLVWLEVPTIDIDGALLVYDARARTWARTHNDEEGAPRPYNENTCTLRDTSWTCAERGWGER